MPIAVAFGDGMVISFTEACSLCLDFKAENSC